jgi:ABC-2 type transport system ATP-binding protein
VIVQIGIAIGIGIERFREKFDPDPDPDPERAGKCCKARSGLICKNFLPYCLALGEHESPAQSAPHLPLPLGEGRLRETIMAPATYIFRDGAGAMIVSGWHPGASAVWSRAMEKLLNVRALERRYGSNWALAGVDLRLDRGEVLGLLGPNGAGKTTCLQLLSGNLAPTAGDIRILGMDLIRSPRPAKRHIGYLPERPPLYSDMRVDEYLRYCAGLRGVPRRQRAEAVDRAKDRCGLSDAGSRPILKLSKGYRQRVGLAQAIVHAPDLVILDEPTEGLDPVQIREVRQLIRALAADCGLILSSHILFEAQAVCSKVLILRGGRVLHRARLDQKGHRPIGRYLVRLERPPDLTALNALPGVAAAQRLGGEEFRMILRPGDSASVLAKRLVDSGWGLAELTPERTDLERVFFDILGEEQRA